MDDLSNYVEYLFLHHPDSARVRERKRQALDRLERTYQLELSRGATEAQALEAARSSLQSAEQVETPGRRIYRARFQALAARSGLSVLLAGLLASAVCGLLAPQPVPERLFLLAAPVAAVLFAWSVRRSRAEDPVAVVWTPPAWAGRLLWLAGAGLALILWMWTLAVNRRSLPQPWMGEGTALLVQMARWAQCLLPLCLPWLGAQVKRQLARCEVRAGEEGPSVGRIWTGLALTALCLGTVWGLRAVAEPAISSRMEQRRLAYWQDQQDPATHHLEGILPYRSRYMGDAVNMVNLFESLPLAQAGFTMRFYPKELTVEARYEWAMERYDRELALRGAAYNAVAAFALVDNLEYVVFRFPDGQIRMSRRRAQQYFAPQPLDGLLEETVWRERVQRPLSDPGQAGELAAQLEE